MGKESLIIIRLICEECIGRSDALFLLLKIEGGYLGRLLQYDKKKKRRNETDDLYMTNLLYLCTRKNTIIRISPLPLLQGA